MASPGGHVNASCESEAWQHITEEDKGDGAHVGIIRNRGPDIEIYIHDRGGHFETRPSAETAQRGAVTKALRGVVRLVDEVIIIPLGPGQLLLNLILVGEHASILSSKTRINHIQPGSRPEVFKDPRADPLRQESPRKVAPCLERIKPC
jgi:hypothetical protein